MQTLNYSVLLVDDDQDVLDSYKHLMDIAGLTAKALLDPTEATGYLKRDWPGVVLLDMYMPQMHGMELLEKIKQIDDRIPVIVITGHGDIPMAVDAVRKGACEFIEKPINPAELLEMLKSHLDLRRAFVEQKKQMVATIDKSLVGKSAQLEQIRHLLSQYLLLENHVVIWGESGSGRHLAANLLHTMSSQPNRCEAIHADPNLSESQLSEMLARVTVGTLLLDGAEQLSEPCQRMLAQHLIANEREGKAFRAIAIFGKDPEQLIAEQSLIPELYYVLNQGVIEMPPLRQRPDDVVVLFHHFLKQSCLKLGKVIPKVEPNYLSVLRGHLWPGNVRELRNVAELFAVGIVKLTGKDKIYTQAETMLPLDELVDDFEKGVIEDALFLHSGRVSDAADYLKVPRKKLYLRMKKHDIDKESFKSAK
ncbi:sigma-54-dependent transcriptional regulator [Vibrio sinaloensis]|uniref:sigma-54-dependent transcriptional regulator n=1 Tax=Photobacterium sp. (strain ATCC 43367) TaxID=379097 RepID=UPI00057FAD8C|nr:sigma-54 dependent transcriptional regulator [Vibrio sinaloensis]KHT47568.1 chemotaxis protein CheY [Vibrio sinaloensis]